MAGVTVAVRQPDLSGAGLAQRSGTLRTVTAGLAALLLLHVVVGAGCFLSAIRRPSAGRIAATAITAALAVAAVAIAVVLFTEAEKAGTFAAEAIGAVGSVIPVPGLGMAALTVVLQ